MASSSITYLDYNATAPIRPEAAEAVMRAITLGGNPSSVHASGRAARAGVEQARAQVSSLVGMPSGSVIFVSGAAEANALAIASAVSAGSRRLIFSAIEHETVQVNAETSGVAVETFPVTDQGVADLAWLADRLSLWDDADGAPFVALMLANNETGVIQPVAEAAALVRARGGWLHVDAVQAAGKIAIDMRALGADTLALSAHKLGGPAGVGALVFGARAKISRQLHGGGQERSLRAGTENVGGIAGFGAAAQAALRDLDTFAAQAAWRDAAADRLSAETGAVVLGQGVPRLANTLCVAAEGLASELQVMQMDLAGVMISAGSACSSGKVKASRVAQAMGRADLAPYVLRVSGGWATTERDWIVFTEAWLKAWTHHGQRQAARQRQPAA
jgi:cysteine desulfurase